MRFDGFVEATLIKRYKRFLADVVLPDGRIVTAHVPNTGSMKSTSEPGSRVALSHSDNPIRKLEWTLELIRPEGGVWVGVNTMRPNRIVEEAIRDQRIVPLRGYDTIRREVVHGRSRIDLVLEGKGARCFVEVKNVTYKQGKSALFPDAVTARGTKHLRELRDIVLGGERAVIFFLVHRGDCTSMRPAFNIDPLYSQTLSEVVDDGVEALAYRTEVGLKGVHIDRKVRIYFNK